MRPDFDEIIGSDGTPEELAELRGIHELLLAADPPPVLRERRRRAPRMKPFFRRSWAVAALGFATVAAALASALAIGLSIGHEGDSRAGFVRPMHGVGAAAAANALIRVGSQDANGNRTLSINVDSLPALSRGWYTLYLTEKGKPMVACGVFETGPSGAANVNMNAPADLGEYDGWIVTAAVPGQPSRVLLTT
jgi:hypothetical protein